MTCSFCLYKLTKEGEQVCGVYGIAIKDIRYDDVIGCEYYEEIIQSQ